MRHGPLILLPAFMFAMVACGGSDDATTGTDAPSSEMAATTTVATTSVPETLASEPGAVEVFSFADDDLCEWVTQEELTGFITEAFDWDGSAVQTPPDSPSAKCEWRLIGDEEGEIGFVSAFDATGGELQPKEGESGEAVDFAALDVVDFSDHTPVEMDVVAVSGHPDLSDGVVAYDYGWNTYVFWVPPRDDYLGLFFGVPIGDSEVWVDAGYFEVADQILHELGWVD
jgi:hypothetical protein